KMVKISNELLEDEAAQPGLPDLLASMFARAMAETENYYFLVGTGSSQPQGAVTASGLGVRAASTSAITAGEIMDLYFSLANQYRTRPNVCWVMDDATEKVIRKIQATSSAGEFLFQVTPGGALEPDTLLGKRVWNASAMPDIAASAKVILFGDWEYYYIAERSGLVIDRNPYLYQANDQTGLFA
ncbi:MAG: phage major capsid protein, partial [Clostridia bacterium]|nr:phage major capsid protein [Clostridia bacterium]